MVIRDLQAYNEDLFNRVEEVKHAIKTYSRSVYVSLFALLNEQVKQIISIESINISQDLDTEVLLRSKALKRFIELNLEYNQMSDLLNICVYAKKYRQNESFTIVESDLFNSVKAVFDLLSLYFSYKQIDVLIDFDLEEFNALLQENQDDLEKSLKNLNDDHQNQIDKLNRQIETIQKEKSLLQSRLEDAERADEEQKSKKELFNKIKIDYEKTVEERKKIQKLLQEKVAEHNDNSDDDELRQQVVNLRKQSYQLEDDEDDLRVQLDELEKELLMDSKSKDINKFKAIIENLEKQIESLKIKSEMKQTSVLIDQGDYNRKSTVLEKIRYKQGAIYFDSNYAENAAFDITNLSLEDACQSKYKSIFAVIFNVLTRGNQILPSRYLLERLFNQKDYAIIYQLQITLLAMIKEGYLGDDLWEISIDEQYRKNLETAYADIIIWFERIVSLTRMRYRVPRLSIDDNASLRIEFNSSNHNENTFVIRSIGYVIKENTSPLWISDNIKYNILPKNNHQKTLESLMTDIFGFESFKEGQFEILANFLNGESTIGILPTGGGKSLTFYMAVLLQPKVSLIVAPINSLIKDQNDKLVNLFNISKVANLTSDNEDKYKDLIRFSNGNVQFTYASPERAQDPKFRNILINLSYNKTIGSVILDEVHCLSEWGHDFRIPYLMLSQTLNHYCEGVKYLGLTATASVSVVNDLMIELNIQNPKNIIFLKHLKRSNLNFKVLNYVSPSDMENGLKSIVIDNYNTNNTFDVKKGSGNAGIIFSRTIKGHGGVDQLYSKLSLALGDTVGKFYGNNKDDQDLFMDDEKTLLVATKAFGMGVDKPNIRFTVHYGMPSSRESFYQEAGRAGRDNQQAACMLMSYDDENQHKSDLKVFFDPNTKINQLKKIQEKLKFKCSISTNLFFLTGDLEDVEEETQKTIILYNEIAKANDYLLHQSVQNTKNGYQKNRAEKYYYILHKIGVLNNWHVSYNSFESIEFVLEINRRFDDIDYIKKVTLDYMMSYSVHEDIVSRIESIVSIRDLGILIYELRTWYYQTFVRSRREQLANIYDFVYRYQNKEASDDIQAEIDQYFDLTELLGKTKEGYELRFRKNTFEDVVKFAFDIKPEELNKMKITMERQIESFTSEKIDIYTSLIMLRLGEFQTSRNGRNRFEAALENLDQHEIDEIINGLIIDYDKLNNRQRLDIINSLVKYDNEAVIKLARSIDRCMVLTGIQCMNINQIFEKIMEV